MLTHGFRFAFFLVGAGTFRPTSTSSRRPLMTSSTSSSGRSLTSRSSRRSTGRIVGAFGITLDASKRSPVATPIETASLPTVSVDGCSLPRSIRETLSTVRPDASANWAWVIPAAFRRARTREPIRGDFSARGITRDSFSRPNHRRTCSIKSMDLTQRPSARETRNCPKFLQIGPGLRASGHCLHGDRFPIVRSGRVAPGPLWSRQFSDGSPSRCRREVQTAGKRG